MAHALPGSGLFRNQSLLRVYDNVRLGIGKVLRPTRSRAERNVWVMHNLNRV
jgi:nitrate/nitrite transport system ATP-binding protein